MIAKILSKIRPVSKIPICLDLIIINIPKSCQEPEVLQNGLFYFHKMSLTGMKVFYSKLKPKVIQFKKYKDFSNEAFMHELESTLSSFSQISFGRFKSTVDNILRKHASIKKRYTRANQESRFIHQ